ncbi:MAG: hypothetical protein IKY52_11290 [Clostridia bacterium]|nr:hypothetical protein [Clostridia bacterium]
MYERLQATVMPDVLLEMGYEKLTERLLDFFRCIRTLTEDSQYRNLKNWLYGLENSMRSIRSLTLGVNLDAQLNVSEVGIVSINYRILPCSGETTYSSLAEDIIRENGLGFLLYS